MDVQLNCLTNDTCKPLKGVILAVSIAALVVGILSLLYQYDLVSSLRGLSEPIGNTWSWALAGSGGAITVIWLGFYFCSETPAASHLTSHPPHTEPLRMAASHKIISNNSRRALLGRATNFCYGASVIAALFLTGDDFKEIFEKKLSSKTLTPGEQEFLECLFFDVINPMRQGHAVDDNTMERCLHLAYHKASWNKQCSNGIHGFADAFVFQTFILNLLGVPFLPTIQKEGQDSERIPHYPIGPIKNKKGGLNSTIEDAWRCCLQNTFLNLAREWASNPVQAKFSFNSFIFLKVDRGLKNQSHHLSFEQRVKLSDIIPQNHYITLKDREQTMHLRSVICFVDGNHYRAFIKIEDNLWIRADDYYNPKLTFLSFQEVQAEAGKTCSILNYSVS